MMLLGLQRMRLRRLLVRRKDDIPYEGIVPRYDSA